MQRLWEWLTGDAGQAAVAGALGGLVRWFSLRENWRDGVLTTIIGAICAVYLGPLAVPALEPLVGKLIIDPERQAGFSGFMIGLGGVAVAGFVIDVWKALRRRRPDGGRDAS